MEDLKQTLRDLGLTDKEVDVYLVLQSTGFSPASVLGQRTGITRSTAQYVCQQLAKRGIVSTTHKGNTFLYAAEPPEKLLLLLEKERRALDAREQDIQRIIGTLRSMQHPDAARPSVRFFDGVDGLSAAYQEILDDTPAGAVIRSYVHPLDPKRDKLKLGRLVDAFSKRRREKGVKRLMICTDTATSKSLRDIDKKALHDTKIIHGVDHGNESATEIILYGNKMFSLTATPTAVFAFIVESETIVSLQTSGFDALWSILP